MTTLPQTSKIQLELDDEWLTIRFNTPENRNALSEELTSELMTTFSHVKDDRSVRGITLCGNGGIFCAGGDLKSFSLMTGGADKEEIVAMNRKGGALFAMVNTMPQVVLALVEGAAIAGGLGLVCCADIVGVTKDAKFSLTETQLGIAPAQIAPYIVQRVGLTTARRLMLTGAKFTGDLAKTYGIADYVTDNAEELKSIQADIQQSVMRCAPGANAITKEIVLASTHLDTETMRTFAAEGFATCLMSDEGREGIMSFVEKRKPKWATQE